ncbi:DUF1906 domain-containing protein [Erysipelothrix rhusiopathiae]|nr:DUF1906 domain-containing protein [Erysipelothrix rhusiopathiae]
MVDIKVQQVQEWLLSTYGDRSEFAQFVKDYDFTATGNTGNTTMVALVMALQYELGISGPSGSFGPTTIRLAPKISLANANTFSSNIIKILEGGLWCHGYSAGYKEPSVGEGVEFGGTYDEDTDAAVKKLQADIGISQSGRFDGYLWKALLSTDAFVTTWTNGSPKIREAQQYLNSLAINGYYFADDFMGNYMPTDGLNNRYFSKALVLYIQANQGIYASEATGNLGPATQAGLVTIPDNLPSDSTKSRHFVRAAVFALLANGYDLTINSYWSQETSNVVAQFQRDMVLPVTGKVDFSTWMSLLISFGDKNRTHTACDTRFEITTSRLDQLKNMGIKAIGRYINGTDFKILRKGELERIIDGGVGVIPIYQENGTSTSDFNETIGVEQANKAEKNAQSFNIPYGSIIYFAVDYDAQDDAITSFILPYFRGINKTLKNYKVGVYGTRNVCQRVYANGLSASSYVSNMSSGYSGNLGFKMPDNWNFDQFDEIAVDDWAIDKVSYSGKHLYVTNYGINNSEFGEFISKLKELESLADNFQPNNTFEYILNFFRYEQYAGTRWDLNLDHGISEDFHTFVKESNSNLYEYFYNIYKRENPQKIIDPHGFTLEIPHYFVTTQKYSITSGYTELIPDFWAGWGGDLATLARQIRFKRKGTDPDFPGEGIPIEEMESIANSMMGHPDYTFSEEDVIADLDAIFLSDILKSESIKLSEALEKYHYSDETKNKFINFARLTSPKDYTKPLLLAAEFYNNMNGILENVDHPFNVDPIKNFKGLRAAFGYPAEYDDYFLASKAFANYLIKRY